MRILLTGFEGWAGKKNPSGMIAEKLDREIVSGAKVIGKVLPEDFYSLPGIIKKIYEELKPDAIISTGWDYTKTVRVERVALNVMNSFFADSIVPDNYGNKPKDETIFKRGPLALKSTLPAEKIVEELRKNKIPASISYFAGTHCCNVAMYSFIYSAKNAISGFIHLPPLPEMVEKESYNTITMPLDLQEKAIRIAIKATAEHLLTIKQGMLRQKG